MKIENIYDKHLQAIEEAEKKVRIAKRNLKEAERELDETLELVEAELDESNVLTETAGRKGMFGIEVRIGGRGKDGEDYLKRNVNTDGRPSDEGAPLEFETQEEAENSDEFEALSARFGADNVNVFQF